MRQVCSLLFLSDLVSVVSKYPLDYSRNPDTDLSMLFFTAEHHIGDFQNLTRDGSHRG